MPTDTKLSKAAQVLLGEAAGEGPQGMQMVADVLFNRAQRQKKTLEEVALAPQQFSASARPDLLQFVQRQPLALQTLAQHLIEERSVPTYQPHYPGIEHYVTRELYNRRFAPDVPSWIQQMQPAGYVGNHVLLIKPKKKP